MAWTNPLPATSTQTGLSEPQLIVLPCSITGAPRAARGPLQGTGASGRHGHTASRTSLLVARPQRQPLATQSSSGGQAVPHSELDCPRTSPHARHMSRRASQVATSAAHCVGECGALGAGDDVGGNVARAQTAKVPRHQRRRAAGSRLDGSRPLLAGGRRRCCLRQLPSNGWVDDRFLV